MLKNVWRLFTAIATIFAGGIAGALVASLAGVASELGFWPGSAAATLLVLRFHPYARAWASEPGLWRPCLIAAASIVVVLALSVPAVADALVVPAVPTGTQWMTVFAIVVAAPLVEETERAVLMFAGQRAGLSTKWILAIQAALFSLVHYEPSRGLVDYGIYALMGLALGLWLIRSGSIVEPMLIHATWNTMAVAYELSTKGYVSGLDASPVESAPVEIAFQLALITWLIFLTTRNVERKGSARVGVLPSQAQQP